MTTYQPFLIANYKIGLERDLEPWLLPEEAFPTIEDAFVFRGRVKRRRGYENLGRLVESITGENAGNANGNVFGGTLANVPISPGSVSITVGAITFTDNGNGTFTGAPPTNTGIINYDTGVFSLSFVPPLGAPTPVIVDYDFHPCRPVMGLCTEETGAINVELLIAFDTVKANLFSNGLNRFIDISFDTTATPISWTGANDDFFWCTNYFTDQTAGVTFGNRLLWATNNVIADRIRFYNGVTTAGWTIFSPQLDAGATRFLRTCRVLIPYKDRLIALNTQEEDTAAGVTTNFFNRVRFSQIGDPTSATVSWLDDTPGRGGFIDAPTSEQIISAAFYKDTLIVYFERSTWRLAYTGDFLTGPFQWERINAELGAESTFSAITFDKGIFAIGDKAVSIATSSGVERIDIRIPDEVFNIHNDFNGPRRVHGIRNYFDELVYWTFPSDRDNPTFPTRLLVLNYREGAYSVFNDSFTTLGYYQDISDKTWADLPFQWQSYINSWGSARQQSLFPDIVGGTPQGFVHILDQKLDNDPCLCITNITQPFTTTRITSVDHNLQTDQKIKVVDVQGLASATFVGEAVGTATSGSTQFIGNLLNPPVVPGTAVITLPTVGTYTDLANGVLLEPTGPNLGTITYSTGRIVLNYPALGADQTVTATYDQSGINERCFNVTRIDDDNFDIREVVGDGQYVDFPLPTGSPYVPPTGSAVVLNNINITTKRFNPFISQGMSQRTGSLDMFLDRTDQGEFTLDVFQYEQGDTPIESLVVLTRAELPTFANQILMEKLWHRVFVNMISEFVQFRVRLSDTQLCDNDIGNSDIVLHALILHSKVDGKLVGF